MSLNFFLFTIFSPLRLNLSATEGTQYSRPRTLHRHPPLPRRGRRKISLFQPIDGTDTDHQRVGDGTLEAHTFTIQGPYFNLRSKQRQQQQN